MRFGPVWLRDPDVRWGWRLPDLPDYPERAGHEIRLDLDPHDPPRAVVRCATHDVELMGIARSAIHPDDPYRLGPEIVAAVEDHLYPPIRWRAP